ncbi:amino acid ABC transporter permease [Variovorax sp. LjRoot290]|uniref:amino acid ABC transporter permease n=1 Tax=unclassified Variovorax TaxID=663243 RepID=UPI003ECF73C0
MTLSPELVLQYVFSIPFAKGAGVTLLLTVASLICGLAIGMMLALAQDSRLRLFRGSTIAYLWLFRGTPVLFQIIFIFNVLPTLGVTLTGFASAVLALSLNEGAYMAEVVRSGLLAVKNGQRTAGLSLGMRDWEVMRHVVIPQALKVILPPLGNQMIGMLKLSALVSVIAVEELLLIANQTASANFKYFEALTAAGIYYLAMTTVFMGIQALTERAVNPRARRTAASSSLTQRLLGITATRTPIR